MNLRLLFVKHLLFLLVFSTLAASDFEIFLGKGNQGWEHVRTAEDRQLVSFYKKLYDKNVNRSLRAEGSIPKTFHLIWLGPNPFPQSSVAHAEKWHELHPDWTFYYWSDMPAEPPCPWMVVRSVCDFDFSTVGTSYDGADNFKEKAFLLSLEILDAEGGVYLDHDVQPQGPLSFSSQFDFFATLAPLKPSIFSSSVFISPYLLGGKPGHPFFTHVMEWYRQKGAKYGKFFPGTAPLSCIYRTEVRIYEALRMGAKKGLGRSGHRDLVFPSGYMNKVAVHESAGVWKQMETIQEQKIRTKIAVVSAQLPVTLILILLSAAMIPLTWIVLLWRRS